MTDTQQAFIIPLKDGPLRVSGLESLEGDKGSIEVEKEIMLCRCGQSANKPFCDGAHVKAEFKGESGPNEDNERLNFPGEPVTFYENVAICSHAGYCASGKPDEWKKDHSDDEIIAMCQKCPSGALSYAIDGKEYRDRDHPMKISIEKDGPFRVQGRIELRNTVWGEGASREHYTLCRCGASKMKPFCDGSHDEVWKNGEDAFKLKAGAEEAKATPLEPHVATIHQMARGGVEELGEDGPMTAMGPPRTELPSWDKIQIMVAQLDPPPLQNDVEVKTELVIGPKAARPLGLDIPIFVSDMSFGALSEEAKISLATGAHRAGTGICSGEGGMLPEEQAANSRYLYELGSGKHGYTEDLLPKIQAFHFKCGQAAKTGTGGHLPACKVTEKIAEVRGIDPGTASISPPTFKDLTTVRDFREFADRVRELTGGIPIGFKISANHLEKTIDFAVEASADYIILDGRGGGTGAAPTLFRDHISVPTIPALARARRHLDKLGKTGEVTLIITGGLRIPADYIKALALGADGVALANAAIQAIGCIGARICNTNRCPAGIATQDPALRAQLNIERSATRLHNFFQAAVGQMKTMARACGHHDLSQFNANDLSTFYKDMAELSGVEYSGMR